MTNTYTLAGQAFFQFGKKVLVTKLRFETLDSVFKVDPEVQRELDPRRRIEIREFILNSLDTSPPFFSPFIFSARGAITESETGWTSEPGSNIYILDGQHRSAAMSSALRHLKSQKELAEERGSFTEAENISKKIELLREYPVCMQIYLNLTQQEERQLFTDINTERREAHVGLVMQYDQRDPYTELTRKVANQLENTFEVADKASRVTMESSALTSLVMMRKCILALLEGNLSVKTGMPSYSQEDAEKIGIAFFKQWKHIFPKQSGNKKKYVCGYTGIQVALAYTVYHLIKNHQLSYHEAIESLTSLKKGCSWKHDDPLFHHLYDTNAARIIHHSKISSIKKTADTMRTKIEKERQLDKWL